MNIMYLNREDHTVVDGAQKYIFTEGSILDVPERLGFYLVGKYPKSFMHTDNTPTAVAKVTPVMQELATMKQNEVFEAEKTKEETEFKIKKRKFKIEKIEE